MNTKFNVVIDCKAKTITFMEPFSRVLKPLLIDSEDYVDTSFMINKYEDIVGSYRMGKPKKLNKNLATYCSKLANQLKDLVNSGYMVV